MPIFDAGRYAARTRQSEARQRQALATYQKTVETAFREVADALTNVQQPTVAVADVQIPVAAARTALRLARMRYDAGYTGLLEVLDAQRTANEAELGLVQNRQAQLAYSVDLINPLIIKKKTTAATAQRKPFHAWAWGGGEVSSAAQLLHIEGCTGLTPQSTRRQRGKQYGPTNQGRSP